MTDNMRIWNAVERTDPDFTKHVNQRGGFTAIDASYKLMKATQQFGPVGEGWGYTVERFERLDQFVIAHVTIWHGVRANAFGPIPGCAEMFGTRPDSDAPKKAVTDAITKGLSQLGFSADVFMGRFDDAKYVADLRAEKKAAEPVDHASIRDRIITAITGAQNLATLDKLMGHKDTKAALAAMPDAMADAVSHAEKAARTDLEDEALQRTG